MSILSKKKSKRGIAMSERRDFLKASLALAAGVAASSASSSFASTGSFPAGVVYTAANPGKWSAKVGSHAPTVSKKGKTITVATKHPMSEIHYIVRHTLVAENGTVIGAMTFDPEDKEAVSTYELPNDSGSKVYATSFCNLHDFWVTEFTL
jgi:superoxide reductase